MGYYVSSIIKEELGLAQIKQSLRSFSRFSHYHEKLLNTRPVMLKAKSNIEPPPVGPRYPRQMPGLIVFIPLSKRPVLKVQV